MEIKPITLALINVLVLTIGLSGVVFKNNHKPNRPEISSRIVVTEGSASPLPNKPELPPIKNSVTNVNPGYMNYQQTVAQIKQWNKEAPEITEVATYGKSSAGKDLYYIRLYNKRWAQTIEKPRVLITACIHGNEPLASSTVMWYIGNLLDKYDKDEKIRQLVDSRDIYFVPVLSPDSYPNNRIVDGVDPNRNFPTPSNPSHQSVAPVAAIQDLYKKIKPNAVMSGHTWGRVYLTPYGDKMQNCPDHEAIMAVMNKMKALSGYRCIRACDMYQGNGLNNPPIRTMGECCSYGSSPIYGTEVDWYYRNGAFAIVCEFGTHQRIPSETDTREEFNKTYGAFLVFLQEAPLVALHPN